MSIFSSNKIMRRLEKMIENATEGKPIESGFDETKMSALETKLSKYLTINCTTKNQLEQEKLKINELISDISHQTKTPLSNILLYTQLLEESELSQQDKENVKALSQQAEKLNFLISSLIKTSRLETGVISVVPAQANISDLIENVVNQALPKANDKNIKILVENQPITALFDVKWTAEAIYNIVDNAVKYTLAGGDVYISVTCYQLFCRIDITDNGMGISEQEIPKVFARFYRSPMVNSEEGVGIGLYLAREIITAQGGYIKVSSKLNEGSTFSVFLPLER